MVDGERDDDDEGQDEAQDEGEGLLQALPLVGDTLVGCKKWNNKHSQALFRILIQFQIKKNNPMLIFNGGDF